MMGLHTHVGPDAVGFFALLADPPNVTDAFYERTMLGIVYAMNRTDLNLLLRCEQGVCREDRPCMEPFFDKSLKGVLLLSPNLEEGKIGFLKKLGIPVVFIYGRPQDPDFGFIDMDNKKGALQAMSHLLAQGHRRIAFIGGDVATSVNARDRYNGYREALENAGLTEDPCLVHHGAFWAKHGYDSMKVILGLPESQRPTALFGANDVIVLGAKQAAEEAGWKIPMDLSLVGFDDILAAQMSDPPLTTIRQPFYEIGQKAVDLLMRLMKDPKTPDRWLLIEPSLITRFSTSGPKKSL